MPASLKFVIGLLAFALILAFGAGYVEMQQDNDHGRRVAEAITGGDADAGAAAIRRFGCGACHSIDGISDARGMVGPSLSDVAERAELAGHMANAPQNMIAWIREPQKLSPGSGMPNLGVGDKDGRDIAAYLYTLRKVPRNP